MCGIVGIRSNNSAEVAVKMNEKQIHRGPDFNNVISYKDVAFGQTRLSIFDHESGANQPMEDDELLVNFNGEVFNYKELADEHDIELDRESDSELVFKLVKKIGLLEFAKKVRGFFAIAVYNKNDDVLHLARDHFGIKPLHYIFNNGEWAFSSEVPALLESKLIKAELREEALSEYLSVRFTPAPYTFFKNIYKVCPGEFITIKGNKLSKEIYFELPEYKDTKLSETDLIKGTEEVLLESVELWSRGDVSLASFLSGGVDSSLIAAIAKKQRGEIESYSIGFKEDGFNEQEYAKQVAKEINVNHSENFASIKDVITNADALIGVKGSPLGVPNEIPLEMLSNNISKKHKAVLSGEGADELFSGYGKIFKSKLVYDNLKLSIPYNDYFQNQYFYTSQDIQNKVLNTKVYNIEKEYLDNLSNKENPVNRFFHKFHIQGLVERLDVTTMSSSLEGRTPFLDQKLVEYVYKNVPQSLKIKWLDDVTDEQISSQTSYSFSETLDTPKYILKKISENYIPNEVIYRKKMGFPVPLKECFDLITDDIKYILNTDLFKCSYEELLSAIDNDGRKYQILWMIAMFAKFHKKFIGGQ